MNCEPHMKTKVDFFKNYKLKSSKVLGLFCLIAMGIFLIRNYNCALDPQLDSKLCMKQSAQFKRTSLKCIIGIAISKAPSKFYIYATINTLITA